MVIDAGAKLVGVAEQVGSHHEHRLTCVGRLSRHLAVIDHLIPEGGAVEAPASKPRPMLSPDPL